MLETDINLWELDTEELNFVNERYSDNRYTQHKLAFAVMLKYFYINTLYPTNDDVIPINAEQMIASQLEITHQSLSEFDWSARSVENYRREIRKFYGFRKPKDSDSKKLTQWIMKKLISEGVPVNKAKDKSVEFFKSKKIEPYKDIKLERYIRSAYQRFETEFFGKKYTRLTKNAKSSIDDLLNIETDAVTSNKKPVSIESVKLRHLKHDCAGIKQISIENEVAKLKRLEEMNIPNNLFNKISRKYVYGYYERIMRELPSEIKSHPSSYKYVAMASFFHIRKQIIIDALIDAMIQLLNRIKNLSESKINKEIINEVKPVGGKYDILYQLAQSSINSPDGTIRDVIFPEVSEEKLRLLVKELGDKKGKGWYNSQVKTKMSSQFSHGHRRILLSILSSLKFNTTNKAHSNVLAALNIIIKNFNVKSEYYENTKGIPIKDAFDSNWLPHVIDDDPKLSVKRINKFNYEVAVLENLKELLKCKAIWVEGAYHYRNPEEDMPKDFYKNKAQYFNDLGLPSDAKLFVNDLKELVRDKLQQLNDNIPLNENVSILDKKGGRIKITPYKAQKEPENIELLQREIINRWSTINLIDVLKEVELLTDFTDEFQTIATREKLSPEVLRKRLLLAIYAIGSNMGVKRTCSGNNEVKYNDLRYIKRTYFNSGNIRGSIAKIINEILAIRDPKIWGEATTGCACDSMQLSSWDQNLMSQWHPRYKGHGVMVYWHVDKNSTCIHSQLKTCLSSEVASMINGVLKHCTKTEVDKTYTDTHGQSVIGFAFTHLLGFDLLPRIKGINKQKLCLPDKNTANQYPNIKSIIKGTIDWQLIIEQYDEIVRYASALKHGTAETDVIIKRFTKGNQDSPVYKALFELGKAVKTIFLCRYLMSEELRIEINESLNIVERVNGIMNFIFYGKLGEVSTNKSEDQELGILCLHLLQTCIVYINTLMIQEVLSDPEWFGILKEEDLRALSPLLNIHINPYGLFPLDFSQRIKIHRGETEDKQSVAA